MKQLRERLHHYGPQTLLTEELLAILLSTGSGRTDTLTLAEKLLAGFGGLGQLTQANKQELRRTFGLSEARVSLFQVALELSKRLNQPPKEERYQILSPAHAARLVMLDMAYLDYEQLRILVLDTKHQVVANLVLYQGTAHSLVLRVAEIFRPAIVRNGTGIIVCHNHPSGTPEPSEEDLEANKQLVAAGQVLDIDVVDHLIIGQQRFVSLKERLMW